MVAGTAPGAEGTSLQSYHSYMPFLRSQVQLSEPFKDLKIPIMR